MEDKRPKQVGRRIVSIVLRQHRAMSEKSLRELAKEIGISAPSLCRLEHGRDFDAETWTKVLNWLMKDGAAT